MSSSTMTGMIYSLKRTTWTSSSMLQVDFNFNLTPIDCLPFSPYSNNSYNASFFDPPSNDSYFSDNSFSSDYLNNNVFFHFNDADDFDSGPLDNYNNNYYNTSTTSTSLVLTNNFVDNHSPDNDNDDHDTDNDTSSIVKTKKVIVMIQKMKQHYDNISTILNILPIYT